MPKPICGGMVKAMVIAVPMIRCGGIVQETGKEQNDWRSHDAQTIHGVPLWLVTKPPNGAPPLARMVRLNRQNVALAQVIHCDHLRTADALKRHGTSRNDSAFNGQAEIAFRPFRVADVSC
ncbi:MAG TPA: hypothetical protein VMG39_12525 [Pseudolabrys sp.]|nr:hypothetical protein [Pseudolabrys sp.]